MFNKLYKKIKLLSDLNGSGDLSMNEGELSYSIFGPMKKAAVLKINVSKGSILTLEMIKFIRTKSVSDMSQIDVVKSIGKKINKNLENGSVLLNKYLAN